jgi:hypothetical protein
MTTVLFRDELWHIGAVDTEISHHANDYSTKILRIVVAQNQNPSGMRH